VGLATQDAKKRASFLVEKNAKAVALYHEQLLNGIKTLLAIMGVKHFSQLNKEHLLFKDHAGKTYMNVDRYFEESIIE
jgi:glutamate synthase domain-containing protein 2